MGVQCFFVLIEQNAVKTSGSTGHTRMAPSFANIGTAQAMNGQYQVDANTIETRPPVPAGQEAEWVSQSMWGRGIRLTPAETRTQIPRSTTSQPNHYIE